MINVNWCDAPEWAQYVAKDADGLWFWHEEKPEWKEDYWKSGGKNECAGNGTLQERPND